MSQQNIRKGLDKALINMPGGLGSSNTAFENVNFTPVGSQPYQATRLLPFEVSNPTLGDDYHREEGVYQIVLAYPAGTGVGPISTMAETIKDFFRRGKTITEGVTEINIFRTPSISSAVVNASRYEIAIRLRYYTNECSI